MVADSLALDRLTSRLRILLPEDYHQTYETMQPVAMGSAGLRYQADGEVAWDLMWDTFCDLAMAGGPPHKGALLEPAPPAAIAAAAERYADVVWQICRGITMVTDLSARGADTPGWIEVRCFTTEMAGWLTRAIAMENVSVRGAGNMVELPAGPEFFLHKQIKNVVTVMAKTCHYWTGHMPREQQRAIAALFAEMEAEHPLIVPALPRDGLSTEGSEHGAAEVAETIQERTGLVRGGSRYDGWLGLECAAIPRAVWMMRALVGANVLSRREGTIVFVPVNPITDPGGTLVAEAVSAMYRLSP